MIYTVTLNPALDYVVWLNELRPGTLNRTTRGHLYPGGKGVNVAITLHEMGIPVQALGFVAGTAGGALCESLHELGLSTEFMLPGEGETRINVKIQAEEETEINGAGPVLNEDNLLALQEKLKILGPGDVLVLAGSLPRGVRMDVYAVLAGQAAKQGARVVVDTSGQVLGEALKAKPFLIKPNRAELSCLLGRPMGTMEQVERAAREAQEHGAQNVLVSLGSKGAALLEEDGTFTFAPAPEGRPVNTVGAGDAMVAGFLAALERGCTMRRAMDWGLAAGTAAACVPWMPTRAQILDKLPAEEK